MIAGLVALLACQLAGEAVARLLDVPVPGPVLGMVLLLVVLRLRSVPDDAPVVRTGEGLLTHLQLFFVPAGVGVLAYTATLRDQALPLVLGLVVSWLVGLAVVGWSVTLLQRRRAGA